MKLCALFLISSLTSILFCADDTSLESSEKKYIHIPNAQELEQCFARHEDVTEPNMLLLKKVNLFTFFAEQILSEDAFDDKINQFRDTLWPHYCSDCKKMRYKPITQDSFNHQFQQTPIRELLLKASKRTIQDDHL